MTPNVEDLARRLRRLIESNGEQYLSWLRGTSAANLGQIERGSASVGYGLVGLDAALGSAHAHRMPRARPAVRDLLIAVATMASARVRSDAVHSVVGLLRDALRTRAEHLAENALLRQQLLILRRHVGRPHVSVLDR